MGAFALVVGTFFCPMAQAKEFMAMDSVQFTKQAGLEARLTVDAVDRELLAAAIFHETNRVRCQAGLPALPWLEKLNEAAEIQSHVGVMFRPPSHTNPFVDIGTPMERVKFTGLVPRYVAENIALIAIYDLGPASSFGISRHRESTTYIDLRTGLELKPHTYASYAGMVVQAWMNSPGHRKNIMDPSVKYLGCSVCPRLGDFGEETVFSVEVFYTPKGKQPPAEIAPVPHNGWLIGRHGS
jgi:uncharacterized protein YkwD